MSDGPALTPKQRMAVEAAPGPYVVVAPPGAGKTEVLTRRVLWLLEQSPDEPFRVLALTYTVKAAEELRERVAQALGEVAWRATASTLHAFCHDMIERYGEAVGVTGPLSVLDTDDLRVNHLAEALTGAGHHLEARHHERALMDLLRRLDDLRETLTLPDETPDEGVLDDGLTLAEAYKLYEQSLDDAGAMDFPGMLYRGWRLLTEDPWVASHYQRQFRHVLVDEAQDLTATHTAIIQVLCGDAIRNVFIVADDDQEIYSFAGADSEHYRRLADQLGAQHLSLDTNFRCAAAIVDAAEHLRRHIKTIEVQRQPASAETPARGWIGTASGRDRAEEALIAVEWVARLLRDGLDPEWLHADEETSVAPEDVCVMARTSFGFEPITAAFEQAKVAYVVRTEEGGLFASEAGQALYLGLRCLANPRDKASCARLAKVVGTSSAPAAAEDPIDYGDDRDPNEWLDELRELAGLPPELVHVGADPLPADTAWSLRQIAVLVPDVGEALTNDPEDEQALARDLWEADLRRLSDQWERYSALTRRADRSLQGFLRQLSRLQRTPPDEPGVRLLTPYRAKGMQFKGVVVTGLSQGMFPHYKAKSPREIDQERRALYVAVTRASRAVLLTRAEHHSDRYGRTHVDPPSGFLEELGVGDG